MKKLIAALLLSLSTLSSATTLTRDYSDLWYNANEAGWGVNVIQQGDILFMTLFVYSTTSSPVWYVASTVQFTSTTGQNQAFTGQLFQTSGPWFGAAFNPVLVTTQPVGTITFTGTSPTTATLSYTVSGVTVNKNITRQTWRNETLAGVYQGATIGAYSGCASNGAYDSAASSFTITQAASSVTISEFGTGYQCTYVGNYTQAGRMGTVTGTGSCSPGNVAEVFTLSEVQVSPEGLTGRLVTDAGACRFTGRIGGLRRQ